ncbi:hypothetical protein [Streptomyces iranensis]|uniref:hypothetical protein n=1 Tax=Streptomyces iranensis TaxID=576784 RepID=UPI0039B76C2C
MQRVTIVSSPEAGPLTRRACEELRDFAGRLWAAEVDTVESGPAGLEADAALCIVVGTPEQPQVRDALGNLGAQASPVESGSYALRGKDNVVAVVGADDAGALYGSYELLELLGVRFYLSGESLPRRGPVTVPPCDIDRAPAVRLRGFMPYTDFLTGPSTWDKEDYLRVIDSAARLKLNLFSMHFYTFEPVGQFTFKGQQRTEAFWDTSRTTRWHKRPGRISDFVAGREHFADYLADDTFGARSAIDATAPEERFRLAEADIRAAFAHAKERGMRTTIGIEVTDPPLEFRALVDPGSRYGENGFGICPSSGDARELLTGWLTGLIATFPEVDTYTLWQTETGPSRWTAGCTCERCTRFRAEHPLPRYTIDDLLGKVSAQVYDVEDITESAQTFLQWVLLGHDILRELAPDKQVALAGWYIEHLFRDASPYLPEEVVLSSMTEVDPWEAPPLLDHYQGVDRERWLINWWEIDFRMWLPQPKVSAYPPIMAKARRYGIDGIIWQHWRTRTVDDNARYTALVMWQPDLTPDEYYRDVFGVEWGEAAAIEAAEAMRLFERYEQWLCHDLGWQVFTQDWYPPTINQALEFMGVHGAVPPQIVADIEAKLDEIPRIRARLAEVREALRVARTKAVVLRDGDRPGFWEHRVELYQLFIDCLEHVGEAALAYRDATCGDRPTASETQALKRAYEALRTAPVLQLIQKLAERVEDRGDLGTLVNLNNELWSRYRDALDGITRWFTDAAVGGLWTLRILPDGTLRPPVIGPDALRPEGQWS